MSTHLSDLIPEPDVEALASEIESYLESRPAAADTLESIARWWLTGPQKPSLSRVEAALDVLVRRTVVAKHPLPGGRFVYQRARRA